ncbi:MAG TPA: hypothetical protein VFC99_15420 [Acidimicrobiia bacterium]|nr:hypothetical protein [Acidimicrobiia bacterium]
MPETADPRRRFAGAGRGLLGALVAGLVVALVVGAALPAGAASRRGTARATDRPDRILVISLPTLTWSDLQDNDAPNLRRLLAGSAVAAMSTRSGDGLAQLGDGYATISAGTRAATNHTNDGDAFETGEQFGNSTAADVFARRTGVHATNGLVHLGIADVIDTNDALLFDAKIGKLGDTLASNGYSRAVIANADGSEPDTPVSAPRYHRTAVTALMGADGTVPAGAVGSELLRKDRAAPYGVRLDVGAVDRAFRRVWRAKSVVLVEASDLVRADEYRGYVTSSERTALLRDAITHTDRLVGSLLDQVDLRRDAVMVVGPAKPSSSSSLTIAALHAPGYEAGLLKSGTTRRAGFVGVVDVAPTMLEVLGISRPADMEGRAMKMAGTGGSYDDRVSFFVQSNTDGLFRDRLVTASSTAVIVVTILFAIGAGILLALWRWRVLLRWAALVVVGFPVALTAASLVHFSDSGGTAAYWAFVGGVSLLFAAVCRVAGRRNPVDPLLVALAVVVVVHVVDLLTGSHLEFNAVFGYSPTVGIRFSGLGNLAYAQLAASAVILAGLLPWRLGHERGVRIAIAMLAVVLVLIVSPIWGEDFGGTLAATPAFALLAWMLVGRRVTVRTVIGLAGLLVAAGLAAGFIDLLRPADQRTHVGRFFEKVGNEGWSGFVTVLHRKGTENVDTLGTTGWLFVVAVVVALAVFLWRRPPRRLASLVRAVPTLRASAVGFAIAAGLGYALNDSGIAIPGLMLTIAAAALAYLTSVEPSDLRGRPSPAVPGALTDATVPALAGAPPGGDA